MKSIVSIRDTPQNSSNKASNIVVLSQKLSLNNQVLDKASRRQCFSEAVDKFSYTIENILRKPKWFLVFIFGRFNFIRYLYALKSSLKPSSTTASPTESLFAQIEPDRVVDTLNQDGIYADFSLPSDILQGLLQQSKTHNCFAGGDPNMGFKIEEKSEVDRVYDKPFYVARYFNISSGWAEISQLANDPKVRKIADRYIGQQSKYTGASLFWTFPIRGTSQDADQQKFSYFHYDLDDLASLRFCFYLTDVDVENGPHLCIRGSHLKKSLFDVLNFFTRIQPAEKLSKFYGQQKFLTLQGKSGTAFIEDTFCFHKGIPPKSKPRLFLQLHFAAHNYGNTEFLDDRDPDSLQHFQQAAPLRERY